MDAPQLPEAGAPDVADQQQQQPRTSPEHTGTANLEVASADETAVRSSNYNNGYSSDPRGNHSYSAGYSSPGCEYAPQDGDQLSRVNSSPSINYQPHPAPPSRPPSSGVSSGPDRQKQQLPPAKNSVVIKVGMVGDAQIGKTSLMVKYVEGSWDEDYIQTLGELESPIFLTRGMRSTDFF